MTAIGRSAYYQQPPGLVGPIVQLSMNQASRPCHVARLVK